MAWILVSPGVRDVMKLEEQTQHAREAAEVGERMGISQSAVARIESGRRDLRMSTVRRYANAVGVSVRHLVTPQREIGAADAAPPVERHPSKG